MARRAGAPGYPGGVGLVTDLVDAHRRRMCAAPLGAPYAASSAICLRTSLGPGASIVRPLGWSSRETPGDVIASHARRSRILTHLCERLRRRPSEDRTAGGSHTQLNISRTLI